MYVNYVLHYKNKSGYLVCDTDWNFFIVLLTTLIKTSNFHYSTNREIAIEPHVSLNHNKFCSTNCEIAIEPQASLSHYKSRYRGSY